MTARPQHHPLAASLLLVLTSAVACSESDPGTSTSAGSGGGSGAVGASGAPGTSGASGASGASGMGGFTERGVCGQRSDPPEDDPTDLVHRTVVTADSFEGYDEYYLVNDRGFGTDTCVVRFQVTRVGEAPGGCDDCGWTHRVEYGNPEVLLDVDGVCAESELGLDAARIAEIDGSQVAYGYVFEYSGHVSVFMKYDEASATWVPNGTGTWNEETGEFTYDRRDGICLY